MRSFDLGEIFLGVYPSTEQTVLRLTQKLDHLPHLHPKNRCTVQADMLLQNTGEVDIFSTAVIDRDAIVAIIHTK